MSATIRFLTDIGRFVSAFIGMISAIATILECVNIYAAISDGRTQDYINDSITGLFFFIIVTFVFLAIGFPSVVESIKESSWFKFLANIIATVARFVSALIGIISAIATILVSIDLYTAISDGKPQDYINQSITGLVVFAIFAFIFLTLGFPSFVGRTKESISYSVNNVSTSISRNNRKASSSISSFVRHRVYLIIYTALILILTYSSIFERIEILSSKWAIFGGLTFGLVLVQFFIFKSRIPYIYLPVKPSETNRGREIGSMADVAISGLTPLGTTLGLGKIIGGEFDKNINEKNFKSYYTSASYAIQNYVQQIVLLIFSFIVEIVAGILITFEFVSYPQLARNIMMNIL